MTKKRSFNNVIHLLITVQENFNLYIHLLVVTINKHKVNNTASNISTRTNKNRWRIEQIYENN